MAEEGFTKAQSDNLPKVDSFMVAEFFANSSLYISAEIRGIKDESAGRDNYGDAAFGYIQVKREGTVCTVKAKVCPKHKVRNKNYSVTLAVDEQVENVLCTDCAASSSGCKHAITFVMWVHRRSEQPSSTEVECYWRKSKLATVGTSIKLVTLKDFGKVKTQQLPHPSNGKFLEQFVEIGKQRCISSEILKYFQQDNSLNRIGMHRLSVRFVNQGGYTAEEFFALCKKDISEADCQVACKATVDQSANKLWHLLRYGRITASKIYQVTKCKKDSSVLIENIVGSLKIPETLAMQRGKHLEKQVIPIIEEQLNIKLHSAGFLISPDNPVMGASTVAVAENCVVEIKCPTSIKTFQLYVKDGQITNKFKAQIHLQMYFFKKQTGIFCVADPNFELNNKISIFYIKYDQDFMMSIIDSAKIFWVNNIFPLLIKGLKDL